MKTALIRYILITTICMVIPLGLTAQVIPSVKSVEEAKGTLELKDYSVKLSSEALQSEKQLLTSILKGHQVSTGKGGPVISIELDNVNTLKIQSVYAKEIQSQAYEINVDQDGIVITGETPEAVFYALQTFDQLIEDGSIAFQTITDWPDLPIRMLMIDPARQNENFDYYRSLIDFAARYKINAILCHLTDDQTSCLYHEKYPELMHPQAWRPDEIKALVQYAKARYIDLIPEIESLGHSRMFTRRDDFKDFLHQTKTAKPKHGWTGTDMEGYTNVLCPASEKATNYLEDMFQRADETFDHNWLHVGCDEVNMTECDRCIKAMGKQSKEEWILHSLMHCHDLAQENGKRVGFWGDMLLHYPKVIDQLPTESTVIFDWHYREDVSDESVKTFKEKGFEVIASPALVCWPHVIIPEEHNYNNIARFTKIAREHDLLGVNTTIWIPTRYMSDVLWTGIGYAADHAWGGSTTSDKEYITAFMKDHFGSDQGEAFYAIWKEQKSVIWHMNDFVASAWDDDESIKRAQKIAQERGAEIRLNNNKLVSLYREMTFLDDSIQNNQDHWECLKQAIKLVEVSTSRIMISKTLESGGIIDLMACKSMGDDLQNAVQWIEKDWDKNRYPDDLNKDGLYLKSHHIFHQFNRMENYHEQFMNDLTFRVFSVQDD